MTRRPQPRPGPRPVARAAGPLPVLLALLALLAGCVSMPDSGPVVEVENPDAGELEPGTFYDPRPPEPGASAREVVAGFLEAMKATPIKTTVAAQYLTGRAQEQWTPEAGTLTYADLGVARGDRTVTVPLLGAEAYDSRGAWTASPTGAGARLELPMTLEGGEWRIDAAPDAMVVPDSWFEDRFERASLHFLDPTGRILVPEPVHAPQGDQFATALVRGLLAGPPPGMSRVVRSAVPAGVSLALSVPIDAAGLAEVSLEAPPGVRPEDLASEEMVAQLAWTLRQEPRIRAVRLTLNGRPVPLPDGQPELDPAAGTRFDPVGHGSSSDLFALRGGLLVRGDLDDLEATAGPFGTQDFSLRSVGLSLAAQQAAAVTTSGSSLLLAPVEEVGAVPEEVVSGATDLLPPAWDFADRLWWVDRTAAGARVEILYDGERRELDVPGLSGRVVKSFLVSRDGTRLVAVVRGRDTDRLVVGRVLHDETGRVARVARVREIDLGLESGRRIRDLGWRSPSSVTLVSGITGVLAHVRTVGVDGAPGDLDTGGASRVRGRASALVSSPERGLGVYVVGTDGVTDLADPVRQVPPLDQAVAWLGYVG
ncbi:LpqB family beta-propeller domain-containing protein [Nocardioides solisilvae]|uniref:LpqB family beta-propeller domain-containing protein n=1 Tax=Nocardioides solisilvae TaxID=1542435 RepID=UPI000D744188|nr:LpqB family beta-propeller domain-containing protein [Nocardioides solisilvae]